MNEIIPWIVTHPIASWIIGGIIFFIFLVIITKGAILKFFGEIFMGIIEVICALGD